MAINEMIVRAAAAATDVVNRIDGLDLDAPSTCHEWDIRGLANHLTGFLPYSANAARKGPTLAGEGPDFAADPAWASNFAAMADDLAAAWSEPGALDGMVRFGPDDMPSDAAAGITLMELTVHAWDLAMSTGVDFATDDDIADTVFEIVRGGQAGGPSGFFKPPVDVPTGATSLDRALAMSGRNPR